MTSDDASTHGSHDQKAGGIAAVYLCLALLAAIPYFLVVVDYPSATTAADKVDLILAHYSSMYVVYLAAYVLFGIAVGVVALALHERLRTAAPTTARITTAIGLTWSFALVASGLVFTYGMTAIRDIATPDHAQAVLAWQTVEPVAMALGGAGGELLGGLWVLLVSTLALRSGRLPKGLGWLGIVIGIVGLISVVPQLHDATVAFGMLEIVWLGWLGWVLLATKQPSGTARPVSAADPGLTTTGAPR